jgi:hypothetical protein
MPLVLKKDVIVELRNSVPLSACMAMTGRENCVRAKATKEISMSVVSDLWRKAKVQIKYEKSSTIIKKYLNPELLNTGEVHKSQCINWNGMTLIE